MSDNIELELRQLIELRREQIIKKLDDSSPNTYQYQQSIMNTHKTIQNDKYINELLKQLYKIKSVEIPEKIIITK